MQRRDFLRHSAALAALPLLHAMPASAARPAPAAAIGRTPGGITRVAYAEADLAGRAFTLDLFREAGLAPRIDAAGNIFGRVEGSDRSLPPILIGSHVDSVTDGGNYDGPVGS